MRPVGFGSVHTPRPTGSVGGTLAMRFGNTLRTPQDVYRLLGTTFPSPIRYEANHEGATVSQVIDLTAGGKKVTQIDAVPVAHLPTVQAALAQEKALGEVLRFMEQDRGRTLPVIKEEGLSSFRGHLIPIKSLSLLGGDWQLLIGQRPNSGKRPTITMFHAPTSPLPVYNSVWQATVVDANRATAPRESAQLREAMLENIRLMMRL